MKKHITALFVGLFALHAYTNAYAGVDGTDLYCTRVHGADCASRVLVAFQNLGCAPFENSVECHAAETDPSVVEGGKGKDLCTIQSSCHEPHYGEFGQVSCNYGTSGETTVNLARVDRGLTMTVTVGLIRHYVTEICK